MLILFLSIIGFLKKLPALGTSSGFGSIEFLILQTISDTESKFREFESILF